MRQYVMQQLEGRRLLTAGTSAGELDATFSADGFTFVPGVSDTDVVRAVAQQPGGQLIVLSATTSELHLRRVRADGSIDATFGGDGDVATGLSNASVTDLAVDPVSGRIALLGQQGTLPVMSTLTVFTSDGQYDSSFDGDGRAAVALGIQPRLATFQPDGKIVVAGKTSSPDDGVILRRLSASGAIDNTFGSGGQTAINEDLQAGTADSYLLTDLLTAPDGKIIAGVVFEQAQGEHDLRRAWVYRFDAAGNRDFNFQASARLLVNETLDADLQLGGVGVTQFGDVVAVASGVDGSTGQNVVRLTSVDIAGEFISFNGVLPLSPAEYRVDDVALDPAGRIMLTGIRISDASPFAARFDNNGQLDLSYGNLGFFVPTPDYLVDRAVFLQPDGRVVFGGARVTAADVAELVLMRLTAGDGSPADCTLNAKGTLIVHGRNYDENASLSIRGRDGRLVVRVNDYAISYAPSRVKRMAFFLYGGNDTFSVGDGIKGAYCEGGDGNDTLNGGQGGDVFLGGLGRDKLYGNDGDDTMLGGGSGDYLLGGAGKDDLFGNGGVDTLSGAGGNDRLFGGPGDADNINGGAGFDAAALDDEDTYIAIETFLELPNT